MSDSPEIPDDENGTVLRNMRNGGDSLTEPRIVDFNFIFPERRQTIAFAEIVDDKESEVCISYYEEMDMWQAVVKRYMVPSHGDITELEQALTEQAESVGGEADGWGCMRITDAPTP
jgi:hypothetical protein